MRTLVESTVGHHLVDVGLAYAQFGIVDSRHAFPLRVDDEGDPTASPDDQVGACPEAPPLLPRRGNRGVHLETKHSSRCPRAHGPAVAPRIPRIERSSRTGGRGRRWGRLLVCWWRSPRKRRASDTSSRHRVLRPVEHDQVPAQGARGDLRDVRVGEAKLAKGPLVVRSQGKTGELADGRAHDLIERNVGRECVEAAGELLRRDREGRELPRHIESPAQGGRSSS